MKAVKILFGLWVTMLALLGFVTASRYVRTQIAPRPTPTPAQRLTMLDIARNTLKANPNYQCPAATVIFTWASKFAIGTPDEQAYEDNPLLYSCYAVYWTQYQAEIQAINAQRQQQTTIYVPQKPQLHSESCSVIGNTVSCIGF